MSETAGARLARLLALVPWLIANDGVTIAEAADHFGVTAPELERDLWLLVVSGLPGYGPDQLVDIDFWDDGVIHVRDPQTLDRPMRLTPDEAMVLLVSLRMMAQIPGVSDRHAVLSAAAKIESAVEGALPASAVPTIDTGIDKGIADLLDTVVHDGSAVRIRYAGASRDDVTDRTVVPRSVNAVDGVAYLEAWCESAEAIRTFRVDRILSATPAENPGAKAGDVAVQRPAPRFARVALEASARWVADVHGGEVLGEDEQGRLEVTLPMHSTDWATRLILSLRGHALALEPPDLVVAVREAAESAMGPRNDRVG